MKLHTSLQICVIFWLCSCALAPAQDELARLKANYESAVKRATEPLKTAYEKELQKLLLRHTQTGKTDEAAKVVAEMQALRDSQEAGEADSSNVAERYFVRKSWKINSGTNFTFEKGGKGTRTFGGESKAFVWVLKPDGIVETTGQRTGGAEMQTLFFRFESERKGFFGERRDSVNVPMERH